MDKKAKVKQDLFGKSVDQKITYGAEVTSSMKEADGGKLFEKQKEKIAAAEAATKAIKEAKEAADKASAASKAATDTQHTAEEMYDMAFTELGRGVDDTAKGDKTIIDKAGMQSFFPGKAAPIGELPQVQNLSLTEGDNPGELDGHHDPVNGASSYLIQKSITTDDNFTFAATSTSSSFTLTGLGSGVKVWVRVAAVGSAGTGPFSDPAVKFTP